MGGLAPEGRLRHWARRMKREVIALHLAARDPRVPFAAKLLAAAVAAYALSPIDLIPDFIPVLGYLDEVVLLPLGVALVLRLIPPALMEEHRRAAEVLAARPVSRSAAAMILGLWAVGALALAWWALEAAG
jgi:uncharacterized membrane protein YkvA (DUF1232 family)